MRHVEAQPHGLVQQVEAGRLLGPDAGRHVGADDPGGALGGQRAELQAHQAQTRDQCGWRSHCGRSGGSVVRNSCVFLLIESAIVTARSAAAAFLAWSDWDNAA